MRRTRSAGLAIDLARARRFLLDPGPRAHQPRRGPARTQRFPPDHAVTRSVVRAPDIFLLQLDQLDLHLLRSCASRLESGSSSSRQPADSAMIRAAAPPMREDALLAGLPDNWRGGGRGRRSGGSPPFRTSRQRPVRDPRFFAAGAIVDAAHLERRKSRFSRATGHMAENKRHSSGTSCRKAPRRFGGRSPRDISRQLRPNA